MARFRKSRKKEPADQHSTPADDFRSYVEHPRFGRGPRLTGKNPPDWDEHRYGPDPRIPNTAIEADLSKQQPSGYSTRYFYCDERHECQECKRKFIFFAEEQRFWFEELGIHPRAEPQLCCECRAARRAPRGPHRRYQQLLAIANPTPQELAQLIEVAIELIELGMIWPTGHAANLTRMRLRHLAEHPGWSAERQKLLERLARAPAADNPSL